MSCTNTCESNEIKYKGDGSQILFTFPFTYIDETDVKVSLWDEASRRWIYTDAWDFANATTVQFNTAPPAPDSEDITQYNVKIGRCTAIDPLAATFYPGSAIRAQDLNDNFEQLQLAIQEGRCQVPSWLFDYLGDYYWNKQEETTYTDDVWSDEADDEHIPTTGAVNKHVADELQIDYDYRSITRLEQITDGGGDEINDTHYFTTAAAVQRHDTYCQTPKPEDLPYEQPGKMWFDTTTLGDYLWDANAGAWVGMENAGPVGPQGNFGPAGKVIISDKPPTKYPASDSNVERELEAGDLWWSSATVNLYLYYIDNTGPQWVSISKVGPPGSQGPPGPDGNDGGTTYTFQAPLVNNNDVVSIDLQTLNKTN